MIRLCILAIALCIATLTNGVASAGDWPPTSDRISRFCDDQGILADIEVRFRHQVLNVPHLPDVHIVAFNKVRERRYVPFGENRPIARRYCAASAHLSNGRKHKIWYLIEDRMGYAGLGDGVSFCIAGFDRWKVYNRHCSVLQ